MKLSHLISWLAETMSVLGDRDVVVDVNGTSESYADMELVEVIGGDEDELVLNVRKREIK